MYKKTTQIPNVLLDYYLPDLSVAELKILLVIIRQTNGWVDRTGKRKTRDRISHSQFIEKTGLSRRIISQTISKLQRSGLISVTDHVGKTLANGRERTGRTHIFYSSTCALPDSDLCTLRHQPVQKGAYNKTNYTKLKKTKLSGRSSVVKSIGEIINSMPISKYHEKST